MSVFRPILDFRLGEFLTKSRSLLAGTISVEVKCPRETDMMGNMPAQPCTTIAVHKYKYTNTNTQIQIHNYKYTNTNTNIKIQTYIYTNKNTQIQIHKYNTQIQI